MRFYNQVVCVIRCVRLSCWQLSGEYCNLIWSTSPEESKRLLALPEESFVDAVNHAFVSDIYKLNYFIFV